MGRGYSEGDARACHVSPWGPETAGVVRRIRVRRDDGILYPENGRAVAIALLVIIAESFGSLALLAGFLTRFTAASLAVIMLGAIMMVHAPYGFFMNWFGQQQGEGYEYHVLIIGIAAALLFTGAGRWSVDGQIAEKIAH